MFKNKDKDYPAISRKELKLVTDKFFTKYKNRCGEFIENVAVGRIMSRDFLDYNKKFLDKLRTVVAKYDFETKEVTEFIINMKNGALYYRKTVIF